MSKQNPQQNDHLTPVFPECTSTWHCTFIIMHDNWCKNQCEFQNAFWAKDKELKYCEGSGMNCAMVFYDRYKWQWDISVVMKLLGYRNIINTHFGCERLCKIYLWNMFCWNCLWFCFIIRLNCIVTEPLTSVCICLDSFH